MIQQPQLVTLELSRSLKPIDRSILLAARNEWLRKSRKQDLKEQRSLEWKKKKIELIRKGLCLNCHNRPAKSGRLRCANCLFLMNKRMKEKIKFKYPKA